MMRLDKYASNMGKGSRNDIKKMIRDGLLQVNGKIITDPSYKVNEGKDVILFGDETVDYAQYIYVMLNKPKGLISATEDRYKNTVLDILPHEITVRGVFPAGRLDIDTTGLLILTNDGELAHRMLTPSKHVSKTYLVETEKKIMYNTVDLFKLGIDIGGYICKPAELEILDDFLCRVTICEGKYHQIKKMFQSCDNNVVELKRITMGNVLLDDTLSEGEYRYLNDEEIQGLRKITGLLNE